MVSPPPKPNDSTGDRPGPNIPRTREYRQRGGRPGLNVDFVAVCDAVTGARKGSGETMSDISDRLRYRALGYTSGSTRHSWRSIEWIR